MINIFVLIQTEIRTVWDAVWSYSSQLTGISFMSANDISSYEYQLSS